VEKFINTDTLRCQLNFKQHCARWLSVWKRRVAGKLVFKFQKPSDFLAHPVFHIKGKSYISKYGTRCTKCHAWQKVTAVIFLCIVLLQFQNTHNFIINQKICTDSSVVQRWATGWIIGGASPGSGLGTFLLTTASRPALWPTQSHIQWVPEALSLGVKGKEREADHSRPSSAEVKNAWSYTSISQYTLKVWCSIKKKSENVCFRTETIQFPKRNRFNFAHDVGHTVFGKDITLRILKYNVKSWLRPSTTIFKD
jgi:hypothetical protein